MIAYAPSGTAPLWRLRSDAFVSHYRHANDRPVITAVARVPAWRPRLRCQGVTISRKQMHDQSMPGRSPRAPAVAQFRLEKAETRSRRSLSAAAALDRSWTAMNLCRNKLGHVAGMQSILYVMEGRGLNKRDFHRILSITDIQSLKAAIWYTVAKVGLGSRSSCRPEIHGSNVRLSTIVICSTNHTQP